MHAMSENSKTFTEASEVKAKDGQVLVDGPDAVEVSLTPEAALETSERLLHGAMKAEGQRHLKGLPHQLDDRAVKSRNA